MDDISTIDINDFTIKKKIGEGSFGEVYKVKENKSGNIYAAKASLKSFDDNSKETIISVSREVNILSKILHPCILRFIGFSSTNFHGEPKSVIITEYLPNGSLQDIISLERKSLAKFDWNPTRKLINIYGIASAILYLHQHNIVHRDLKPGNILMDDFLCPRIADFGLSKIQRQDSFNTIDSTVSIKGTPLYIAPEIWSKMEYSPASDTYAFGIIVYEIITIEEPFKDFNMFDIRTKVLNGDRPSINSTIPDSYRDLIERCWSQEPEDRPTFAEIVELIKTDDGFTEENVDKDDFLNYIDYIDNFETTFDSEKRIIPIDKFIKHETKTFQKISISKKKKKDSKKKKDKSEKAEDNSDDKKDSKKKKSSKKKKDQSDDSDNQSDNQKDSKKKKSSKKKEAQSDESDNQINDKKESKKKKKKSDANSDEDSEDTKPKKEQSKSKEKPEENETKSKKSKQIYPFKEYRKLSNECKQLVDEAKDDPEKQFEVGICLIEGDQNFPIKTEIGIKFLEESINNGNLDSALYYSRMLIEAQLIPQDLAKADQILSKFSINDDSEIPVLCGLIKKKQHDYKNAADLFKMAAKAGNGEGQYEYGIMLYKGKGCIKNLTESKNFLNMSKRNGFDKSDDFLKKHKFEEEEEKSDSEDEIKSKTKPKETKEDNSKNKVKDENKNKTQNDNENKSQNYSNKSQNDYIKDDNETQNDNENKSQNYINKVDNENKNDNNKVDDNDVYKDYNLDVKSLFTKGVNYQHGEGGYQVNAVKAAKYYKMAADRNHTESMYNYACMLDKERDDGVETNIPEAIRYYKKAIQRGYVNAMHNYAYLNERGIGIPVNKEEAAHYYKMAADGGNDRSMLNYGIFLSDGIGVPVDKKEAARYLKMSSDAGNIDAKSAYALMLEKGDGIQQNPKEAVKLYKEAINKGNSNAMINYGLMLKNGNGIPVDKKEAIKYYKMAIQKGNATAMYNYAVLLSKGDGIPVDKEEAARYLKMAGEHGDVASFSHYAYMLYSGDGIQMDKQKAASYYKLAADKGYVFAMKNYATIIRTGDGVPIDKEEAARYYKMAADLGDVESMKCYAYMKNNAEGIEMDKEEADRYYNLAHQSS